MSNTLNNGTTSNMIQRTAAQTAVLMAILTLISKGFGFVREMVIAGFYGTSYVVDAYVMSQSIPGILFGGFFASIGTSYMPLYSDTVEKNGAIKGNEFTSEILNLSWIISLIAIAFGFFFSDDIILFMAPNFSDETSLLTSYYLKITFFTTIFICATSIFDAFLQYNGSFFQPIISGYCQSLGIILFAIISIYSNYYYLAFGYAIGYAMRFFTIFWKAHKIGFRYSLAFNTEGTFSQIAKLSIPVFVSTYASQVGVLIDKVLASNLQEGSISALHYGMLIVSLITGFTSTIVSTIMYPKITKARSEGNIVVYNAAIKKATSVIIIILLPFTLGAMAFSDEVIQLIYERGAFDIGATKVTASAFFYYSIGMIFMALNTAITYIFYSLKDMKSPLFCSIIGVMVDIILNIVLVQQMAHRGLALATSIGTFVTFMMAYLVLTRKYQSIRFFDSRIKIAKVFIASLISVLVAITIYTVLSSSVWLPKAVYLMLSVMGAIVIYLLFLQLFKIDEIRDFKSVLRIKIF